MQMTRFYYNEAAMPRILILFCALTAVVPLFTSDLFPFSAMPMFSDAPKALTLFETYLPDGTRADPARFGLQINYIANTNPKLSAHQPPSLNACTGIVGYACYGDMAIKPGELVSENALRRHVEPYLIRQKIAWVRVEQKILSSPDGNRVAVTDRGTWKVMNPSYE
jgi:hypothetical protein